MHYNPFSSPVILLNSSKIVHATAQLSKFLGQSLFFTWVFGIHQEAAPVYKTTSLKIQLKAV